MLDHVSIGVADTARSKAFYDAVLGALGYSCLSDDADAIGYGRDTVAFWVNAAKRPVDPDADSGLHFCFAAPDRASVKAFHKAALGAGGSDNGSPGIRKDYGPDYYAAFAVDPDGYRIEAYCNG